MKTYSTYAFPYISGRIERATNMFNVKLAIFKKTYNITNYFIDLIARCIKDSVIFDYKSIIE